MNAQDLIPYIGKTAESGEVRSLLAELGVEKTPRLKPDELDATVDLPSRGMVLVFAPVEEKSSELKLSEIQIFSDVEKGFTTFAGQLPRGLAFEDSRAAVLKKLGKPAYSRREFRLETWDGSDASLTVKFAKGEGRIQMLHLGAPSI